jgi:hypothetical protein
MFAANQQTATFTSASQHPKLQCSSSQLHANHYITHPMTDHSSHLRNVSLEQQHQATPAKFIGKHYCYGYVSKASHYP